MCEPPLVPCTPAGAESILPSAMCDAKEVISGYTCVDMLQHNIPHAVTGL